jgi:hypothetical protein
MPCVARANSRKISGRSSCEASVRVAKSPNSSARQRTATANTTAAPAAIEGIQEQVSSQCKMEHLPGTSIPQ